GVDGTIAGIPAHLVPQTSPVVAEDLVRFSRSAQPNVFPAPDIEREVQDNDPAQPANNDTPGVSAAWELVYDAAVRGDAIPPPYHDVKVTDREKLANATQALK